jgi:hypothetical protein
MSASRLALVSMLSAILVVAGAIGLASARGGGRGKGGNDAPITTSLPASGTTKQLKTFKTFGGKACRSDYTRLCPRMPIGRCDLQSKIGQLSPACKAFVVNHR